MIAVIVFESPVFWICLLPLTALLGWAGWRQSRRGLPARRIVALLLLRALPLLGLVCLAARPVCFSTQPNSKARPVLVLMDHSESMSLKESESSRYQQAVEFLNRRLLPALQSAGLAVQSLLFDQNAQLADANQIASARPDGKRTNLGGAIVQAVGNCSQPPLAVIALTDGIANEGSDNTRALGALTESHIPFIGVGFGSDQGVQTLSLRRIDAPTMVAPRTAFTISAELELMNADTPASFDLVLFRDGQVLQRKAVKPAKGSRSWLENFQLNGEAEGVREYMVQVLPLNVPNLKCVQSTGSASVKIADDKELRVLYVQGALTWDYKFIGLALKNDGAIKLTGLTRTSKQSVFRQNVENAGELLKGFPASLEELAGFRVVILSNLRPEDLSEAQQQLLARFCGELGGGVLIIGGPASFDSSWQHSRLEQLLPVVFAANPGVGGLDRPFHLQLSEQAAGDAVFQIGEDKPVQEQWSSLPAFTQYGHVDAPKLGAQVWMLHPQDVGPHGRRILMASQRYGSGVSAVLCIQNFWRWRLAKESNPQQFDRFWRQLFRWLGDVGRPEVNIRFADQELQPQSDVNVSLERQPNPQNILDTNCQFVVQVENSQKHLLKEESVELRPSQPIDFRFSAQNSDIYAIKVLSPAKALVASRTIEVRDTDVELQQTGRDMETLRQWASVTDGLAFKAEDCPKATDLVAQIKNKVQQVRQTEQVARPAGLNWWTLGAVLCCLSGEWLLRKRWELI